MTNEYDRIMELDRKVIDLYNKLDCSQPLDMNEVCKHSKAKAMLEAEAPNMVLMLREQQAKIDKAVEALEVLSRLGNGEHLGNSHGNVLAQQALSELKEKDDV